MKVYVTNISECLQFKQDKRVVKTSFVQNNCVFFLNFLRQECFGSLGEGHDLV